MVLAFRLDLWLIGQIWRNTRAVIEIITQDLGKAQQLLSLQLCFFSIKIISKITNQLTHGDPGGFITAEDFIKPALESLRQLTVIIRLTPKPPDNPTLLDINVMYVSTACWDQVSGIHLQTGELFVPSVKLTSNRDIG